jgi:hypothetical protein
MRMTMPADKEVAVSLRDLVEKDRFLGLKLLRPADLEEINEALDMADDCVKERANRGWYEVGEYGPSRWDGELWSAVEVELKRRADNADS